MTRRKSHWAARDSSSKLTPIGHALDRAVQLRRTITSTKTLEEASYHSTASSSVRCPLYGSFDSIIRFHSNAALDSFFALPKHNLAKHVPNAGARGAP